MCDFCGNITYSNTDRKLWSKTRNMGYCVRCGHWGKLVPIEDWEKKKVTPDGFVLKPWNKNYLNINRSV